MHPMARALPRDRPPRRRPALVRAAAIAVLVSVVGAVALALTPNDRTNRTTKAGPASIDDLDGAAKELVDLLEEDRKATFHAVYEVTSADFAGASVAFETWRRSQTVRSDITVTKPDGIVRTRQLVLESGAVACQQTDDQPWACAKSPGLKDPFQGDIVDQVAAAKSVTANDRVIDGRSVRCFTLTRPDATAQFCATGRGVPVLVKSAGTSLRLTRLEDKVGDVFEPPATPVA